MPTYQVTDPGSGRKLRLTGDSPPTEAELEQIFSQYKQPVKQPEVKSQPIKQETPLSGFRGVADELQQGKIKPKQAGLLMMNEAVEGFYDWASKEVSDLTPKLVKDWAAQEMQDMAWMLDTPIGKKAVNAIASGKEQIEKFEKAYPEQARIFGAGLTVSSILPAAYGGGKPATPTKWGTKKAKNWDWLEKVTEPYQNIRQRRFQENKLTPKDKLGTYQFPLDAKQKDMLDVLKTVPGMNKSRFGNTRDHKNLVIQEISNASQDVQKKLVASGAKFSDREIETVLKGGFKELLKDPRFAKFRGKDESVENAINLAMEVVEKHKVGNVLPADNLWKARQEIDDIFQYFAGPRRTALSMGSVDPATLIPTQDEVFWKTSRQAIHKLLETKVPGNRERLKRISILYSTKDMMIDKIASQKIRTTLPGRVVDKTKEIFSTVPKVRPVVR